MDLSQSRDETGDGSYARAWYTVYTSIPSESGKKWTRGSETEKSLPAEEMVSKIVHRKPVGDETKLEKITSIRNDSFFVDFMFLTRLITVLIPSHTFRCVAANSKATAKWNKTGKTPKNLMEIRQSLHTVLYCKSFSGNRSVRRIIR